MRANSRRTMLIALIALTLPLPLHVACGQTPEEFAGVDMILNDAATSLNLSGYTFVVVRDGETLYSRSFGNITPTTPVQLASATKWMSGAVIMALVDAGAITLDDTTGQWLGWTGEKGTITIRQLFSHTSGITPDAADCIGTPFSTLQACAAQIEALDLVAAPGAEINYGGNSMHVAGAIGELATGTSWINLFQTYVKDPLGLVDTEYGQVINPRIAGGMVASVNEYGHLLQMLLNDGRFNGATVLTPASVDAMLANQAAGASIGSLPPTADDRYMGYGVGNWVFRVSNADEIAESASPGLFGFTPWIDRERNYYAIFAVVDLNIRTDPYARQLREEVMRVLDSGDLDCDFDVTSADAMLFVDMLLNTTSDNMCDAERADVNRDGAVDGADVEPFVARLIQ
ncbi:MAG TPA: serine hydrolase [Phycisphaerae bacterium]|nr:serine hydrolase [Phycisphaerae bacterium]HRW51331.1 serine hydrolase [Phycisphaerae bacterium]